VDEDMDILREMKIEGLQNCMITGLQDCKINGLKDCWAGMGRKAIL
jgi:hypothetical protein